MRRVLKVFTNGTSIRGGGSVCLRDVKAKARDWEGTLTHALHEAASARDNVNNVRSVAVVIAADPFSD